MKCEHKYTRNVLSGNTTHYAKAICTDCGKFVSWKPKGSPISELLNVPFKDKEDAKLLGARWDKFQNAWYCPNEAKMPSLSKWQIGQKSTTQSLLPPIDYSNPLRKYLTKKSEQNNDSFVPNV